MRIDTHTYVGHWPYRRLAGNTCGALAQRLQQFGIDRGWVSNINGIFYQNCHESNKELAEDIQPYRECLIPFAVLNPTYPDWEHDLQTCTEDFGMRGIRLYPQYHGYTLGDRHCMSIIQAARERKLPVCFTVRMVDERQQSWLDTSTRLSMDAIAGVIASAPEGRYQILHALPNGFEQPESIAVIHRARVLFDTIYGTGVPVGFISAYTLQGAMDKFGAERFAFGSATPFRDYPSHVLRLATLEEADQTTRERLWHENAERFLET